jgi:hypothetical protein
MMPTAVDSALFPPPRRQTEVTEHITTAGGFRERVQNQLNATGQMETIAAYDHSSPPVPAWAKTFMGGSTGVGSKNVIGALPSNIEWPEGEDVSTWPETVKLDVSNVGNGLISWKETGDRLQWPDADGTNANAWIIHEVSPGKYKAETWEYVAAEQTTKQLENIEYLLHPKSGDRIGIMLAGITRTGDPNIEARSNVDWITWP